MYNTQCLQFTIETLFRGGIGEHGYTDSEIRELLDELDCTKGIGLIERIRKGQGKPSRIYIKNFAAPSGAAALFKQSTYR